MGEEGSDGRRHRALEWVLRVGVAGCFVGHGAFGIIGKEAWLPYFGVVGLGEELAWRLMPLVGGLDVLVGILALVSPRPAILGYMVLWALWTALLRPLAGESVWETAERAGNYGVPLAFLVAAGASLRWRSWSDWLARARVGAFSAERRAALGAVLRVTTALVMVGHGALALQGKALLAGHLAGIGLSPSLLPLLGWTEIGLGAAVALRPGRPLLLGILGWKLATEALYPLTGAPFWEFVERAGSYAAPLLLFLLLAEGHRRTASAGAGEPSAAPA